VRTIWNKQICSVDRTQNFNMLKQVVHMHIPVVKGLRKLSLLLCTDLCYLQGCMWTRAVQGRGLMFFWLLGYWHSTSLRVAVWKCKAFIFSDFWSRSISCFKYVVIMSSVSFNSAFKSLVSLGNYFYSFYFFFIQPELRAGLPWCLFL
jgi:hypothetical protein